MDLGLAGRRAVITGASKGIGLGCAVALAREGCDVALAARSADVLAQAAKQVQEEAPRAAVTTHAVDLSTAEGRQTLLGETGCDGGGAGLVDIWVNNAGAIPAGDIVTVEQVADVVAFLASDRASHVSGTSVTIDGGASAR